MSGLRIRGGGVQRDGRWIVRGANLDLPAGELTCLVGPNGSGKSTLMRLLTGLWVPDEGAADLDERPLAQWGRRRLAQRVAFVPQESRVSFDFTVRDVVAMGRYAHEGRLGRGDTAHPAVKQALVRTDLVRFADRLVTTLSGGEHQRVLLARCLASEARIILLDEPTSALDLRHALEVMGLCRSLTDDGKAVAVAIHDLNAALRFAHRVVVMGEGRIVAQGPPRQVLTEGLISEVFGVRAEALTGADGERTFLFHPG